MKKKLLLAALAILAPAASAFAQVGQQPGVTSPSSGAFAGGTITAPLLGPTGSCAAPNFSWTGDTDSGLCQLSANYVALQTRDFGSSTANLAAVQLREGVRSALYYHGASGLFNVFSAEDALLQMGTSGVTRVTIDTAKVTSTLPFQGPVGSAAAPTYSFSAETDMGCYRSGANDMACSTGASGARGTLALGFNSALLAFDAGGIGSWFSANGSSQTLDLIAGGTVRWTTSTTSNTSVGVPLYVGAVTTDQLRIVNLLAGAGAFSGTITSVDLTAAHTWTLPNISGTFQTNAGGTVASAASIDLLAANVPHISGTTTITSVTIQPAGRCVTLIFDGVLTFTDGSNLILAGDFVTSGEDTISLCSDGTNWRETARSVN